MITQKDADRILSLVSDYEDIVRDNAKSQERNQRVAGFMQEAEKRAYSQLKGFVQLLVTHD